MIVTMQDRETLTDIVTKAVAAALAGNKPAPVVETRTEPAPPVEKTRITVQELLDKVREYRATLKKHDRVMEQFRNHTDDSKNANRAREKARDELEEAEEGFLDFCKAVAAGTTVIERGTR